MAARCRAPPISPWRWRWSPASRCCRCRSFCACRPMPAPRSAAAPRRASRPIDGPPTDDRRMILCLLAWNIRQGGGTRLARIIAAIAQHEADVLVISEYRGGESGERLRAALAAEPLQAEALAIGDFNTCRAYIDEPGAIDPCAHFMDGVAEIGFCDLWRRLYPDGREFSWYSTRGNGFRIDHAFLSPALVGRTGEIRYSHDERTSGLSDHSALLLDFDI